MTPSRLRWGIFWILVGLVMLANTQGWLSWWVWADLLHLWPVLLIAIGLELIVKRSKMQWLGYLSTLMIVGAFAWAVSQDHGWRLDADEWGSPWRGDTVDASVLYAGQQRVALDLQFHDGRLYLDEGSDKLFRVRSQGSINAPSLKADETSPRPWISVRPSEARHEISRFFHIKMDNNNWRSYLHSQVPATVELDLEDCDFRFDGRHIEVDTLKLVVDDCDLVLRLGDERRFNYIEVTGRDSDLFAYLPDSIGLKVEGIDPGSSGMDRYDLVEADDFFVNDLYGQAVANYHIKCDINDGRLKLRRY